VTLGDDLDRKVFDAVFGRKVIQNNFRATYFEFIVGELLGPDWRHFGLEWAGFDFLGPQGERLEVKQSAARQSWAAGKAGYAPPQFDIRERTGRWEGPKWIPGPGRQAHIYVFGWHPVTDEEQCDQRDPEQWEYYVARADQLPPQKGISLGPLRRLVEPVGAAQLRAQVDKVSQKLELADLPDADTPHPR